uniref:Major facilitator superfamily (MFS) profile domain-containing protein n=1 Tax=Plectus sambesii TaxID=2011161 RepID=A0A914UR20_9BILA
MAIATTNTAAGNTRRVFTIEAGTPSVMFVDAPSKIAMTADCEQRNRAAFFSLKSTRLGVACLMCYSMTAMALMRTNLAVALVCMVNSSVLLEQNSQLFPQESLNNSLDRSQDDFVSRGRERTCQLAPEVQSEYNGELNWTSTQISLIFSAIFWGGLVTGVFSGWLADRYGPKNILLAACVVHVIGSFLTPTIAVRVGFYGMVGIRFIMGLGQGVTIPCMGALIARWFPSAERSTAIAIYTTGNQLGTMIANPVGAFLCGTESFLGGWPAIFYVFGTIGVVWCVCWSSTVSNSPENNRLISNNELMYLQQELKSQSLQNRKVATQHVPWAKMFRSGPILAQMTMNAAAACFMSVYQSYLPIYFMQVLALNLKQVNQRNTKLP